MLLNKKIPFRYIFGQIRLELVVVLIYGLVIEVLYQRFDIRDISIPMTVPTVLGTIISLLLAFRSNQAYDRWWEARIVWGAIVNDSRTLARQALTLVDDSSEPEEVARFRQRYIRRQIAWCYALAKSLRGLNPNPVLAGHLNQQEAGFVAKFDNAPAAILDLHARDLNEALQRGWINRYQQIAMDETLTRLCDSMGKCERIKNTVFPSTYSLYIHLALNVFILLLPFGLVELFGFIMVPVLMVITACFFLIEKMAIHLQDPFENKATDTPVMTISRGIDRTLRQMLREPHIPKAYEPKKFYAL